MISSNDTTVNTNDLLMEIIQNPPSTNNLQSILKLKEFIRQNSLFSLNEELDDLPTEYIKFLLLDYFHGRQLEESPVDVASIERLQRVMDAFKYYNDFIELVKLYGFPTVNENTSSSTSTKTIGREEKIRQLKEMKELRSNLELLSTKMMQHEEDLKREYWIKYVEYSIKEVQQERLRMIQQELQLLESVKNKDPKTATATSASFKPFVLLPNKRVELQDRVFKPSHRLPTMTIDEYLQKEYERGGIISNETKAINNDSEEQEEEEDIVKKRQWDDFKDDNKRGWGNRMNKG